MTGSETEGQDILTPLRDVVASAKAMIAGLPDGEYVGLGELRIALKNAAEQRERGGGSEQTIPFDCGCFVKFWAEDGRLQSGLACCSKHESSHQTLANLQKSYDISFVYRDGLVEVTKCLNCKTPLMRIYRKGTIAGWDSWIHNDPKKANYRKKDCSERAPGHSTAQIAIPDYDKIRVDCPPERRSR